MTTGQYDPNQPVPQPRKRHRVRNTFLVLGAFAVVFAVIGAIAGGHPGTAPSAAPAAAVPAVTASPVAPPSPAPAPAPTAVTPTKVEFIVSGYAPGDGYGSGPSVNYGSDSDSREAQPADINGTVTYSVPFDPSAMYYSVDAQLSGTGHLSCKIVVTGPYPDVPTTVSTGHAEGGYSICSAQAAPSDPTGLNWQNEN